MNEEHRQKIVATIVVVLVALTFVYISRFITTLPPQIAIVIPLCLLFILLSFTYHDIAAICLILSMILSPEINLFSLDQRRDVVFRLDDLFILIFFVSWLMKMAFVKKLTLISYTPVNRPILAYILILTVSTTNAFFAGDIKYTIYHSIFYLLKYIEFFMVFFMFTNLIKSEKQMERFLMTLLATALLAGLFGVWQVLQGVYRITLPFEGVGGEANTFGGYLLLILGFLLFAMQESPNLMKKAIYAMVTVAGIFLVFYTYSRAAYLGLAVMVLVSVALAKPIPRVILILILFVSIGFSHIVIPESVKERVLQAFSGTETYHITGEIGLNKRDSPYSKVEATQRVLEKWQKQPIIGRGVTNVGIVDTQYPRVLGEGGILGVFAFLWMIYSLFKSYFRSLKFLEGINRPGIWRWRSLTLGMIAGLLGLLFHAVGANTFMIIRIMEPFWFMSAMVVAIPVILSEENSEEVQPSPAG